MAGGATIDHIIAVTILLTAMLLAMMTFNGLFAQALDYDNNRQVANKAVDIMNTICLSSGSPEDWGETNDTVSGFGLQDPDAHGYTLSPYSLMRLQTSGGDVVEYPKTPGVFYNNLSSGFGSGVFTPIGDCLTYDQVVDLLSIEGEYGFSIDISPILDVEVTQLSGEHLILQVNVTGSTLPLNFANLKYNLFHIDSGAIIPYSGTSQTDQYGQAIIEFGSIDDLNDAFSFVVYVELGGVTGVGYYAKDTVAGALPYIVPLIKDFDAGEIIIAHAWDVFEDPGLQAAVQCNASFFVLTSDFQFQEVAVDCPTGPLNYGEGKPFFTLDIPDSEVGILIISYKKSTNEVGSVIVPWGVGTLGVHVPFGGSYGSLGYDFVATELRQVTIDDMSYQVKVSVWDLNN